METNALQHPMSAGSGGAAPTTMKVRICSIKKFDVEVEDKSSVFDLKLKIEKQEGIPPDQQRLFIERGLFIKQRIDLDDGQTLASYGLQDGSQVQLGLKLRGSDAQLSCASDTAAHMV